MSSMRRCCRSTVSFSQVGLRHSTFLCHAAFYSTPGKVKVRVTRRDGAVSEVAAPAGLSLMAVLRDVAKLDIAGSCDGRMECGTCHVYLSEASFAKAPDASEREEDLLAKALEVRETSRLACQVMMTKELDGLEVTLPSYSSDY